MTQEKAEEILQDENIENAAMVLSALDFIQAKWAEKMERELKRFGKYSESDVVTATDKALKGVGYMSIMGNGHGIKVNLSVFLNGLKIIGQEEKMEKAITACQSLEQLEPQ